MNYLLTHQETQRLHFRALSPSDFDAWLPLFAAPDVATFLEMDATLSPQECCQQWFSKSQHREQNGLGGMNVLIDKSTGLLVGQCGLLIQTIEKTERLEIGYSILPQHWGSGYATEAAQKCRDYAFEHHLADSLVSMVHTENIASERVAIKNGMKLECTVGSFNVFGITRYEWKEMLKKN